MIEQLTDTKESNISMSDLMEQIMGSKRRDFVAPRNEMLIIRNDSGLIPSGRKTDAYGVMLGGQETFSMSRFCTAQLNTGLSAGFGRYAQELDSKGMQDLYIENANALLKNKGGKAQIRVLENGDTFARAIVSDRYSTIDDPIIFGESLKEIAKNSDRFKAIGGYRTDSNTYARFVSRDPVFTIKSGGKERPFSAGFMISNSEVGTGASTFSAFFTDSYCNNGLIFNKATVAEVNMRHIGASVETDFGEIYKSDVDKIKDTQIASLIRKATIKACSREASDLAPFIQSIEASTERHLAGDEDKSIANVLNRVGIPKNDLGGILREMDSEDNSQFGLQAAVTQFAQKSSSYEKRIDFEKQGAEIIKMTDRQWDACQALN